MGGGVGSGRNNLLEVGVVVELGWEWLRGWGGCRMVTVEVVGVAMMILSVPLAVVRSWLTRRTFCRFRRSQCNHL